MKTKASCSILFLVIGIFLALVSCTEVPIEDTHDTHVHIYSSEWTYDETYHWHSSICEHEDLVSGKEKHSYVNHICSICGFVDYSYLFSIDSYGRIKLIDKNNAPSVIVIPSKINGISVTGIGDSAFANCISLTSITIPNSVHTIWNSAFSGCSSLTSITIPKSVTSLGEYAFLDCNSLTSITISDSVSSIGGGAFGGCSSLTSITIPNSVRVITWSTFYDCSSLTSVTIPYTVERIEWCAFSSCNSLTSITIPNSVKKIAEGAFNNCKNLTSIIIPDSLTIEPGAFFGCSSLTDIVVSSQNKNYTTEQGMLFNKTKTSLIAFPSACGSIDSIPDSVTCIGAFAFGGCSNLTSITIPVSVTTIGDRAFSNCNSLSSISYEGTTVQWESIVKGDEWKTRVPVKVVHCTDGDVTI